MTKTQIAILKYDYPEGKLSEEEQNLILTKVTQVFRLAPSERLPHLRSYRLEGSTLIYVCTDQRSVQWLIEAINGHRLKVGTLLKALDAKDLPRPVKMVLRTWDKQPKDTEEMLTWI